MGKGYLGRTVAEYDAKVRKINAGYVKRLKFALILIIVGFLFQIWATWE